MTQYELDYKKLEEEMINTLQKHEFMCLATSADDLVTNRSIRIISDRLTIWVSTGVDTRKFKQITKNPNVALAGGNLQIEGITQNKGQVMEKMNEKYRRIYKEKYPKAFEFNSDIYFQLPEMVVLEIHPTRFTLFKTKGPLSETYYDILDVTKKEACRVMATDISNTPSYNG